MSNPWLFNFWLNWRYKNWAGAFSCMWQLYKKNELLYNIVSIYLIENVQLTRVAFNVNPQFRRSNYSTRNGVSTYIVMFTYTYINDTFWVQMVLWIAIFDICTIAKSLKWANNRFLCKYTNMQCLKLTPIATILRRRFKFI